MACGCNQSIKKETTAKQVTKRKVLAATKKTTTRRVIKRPAW